MDNTPLFEACIFCLGLEATTDAQAELQEQCEQTVEQLIALEECFRVHQASDFHALEA